MQITADMPGATAELRDRPLVCQLGRESIEIGAIEGLVLELPGDVLDVIRGHPVVAVADVVHGACPTGPGPA